MSSSAKSVWFDQDTLWVDIDDGRTVGVPIAWFPRLMTATPEQRSQCRISASGAGLHWEELDEDISVAGLLAGRGDLTRTPQVAA